MKLKIAFNLLFLLFSITFAYEVRQESNLAVAVSQRGLDFFGKIAENILEEEVQDFQFSEVTIPFSKGIYEGYLFIESLEINDFEVPSIELNFDPPNQILLNLNDGRLQFSSDWSADYSSFLLDHHLEGTLDVTVYGIQDSSITFSLYGYESHPQIEIEDCSVDVENVDVSLDGEGFTVWIIKTFFDDDINSAVINAINDQACEMLRRTFLSRVNRALRSKPTSMKISDKIRFDYQLEEEPFQVDEDKLLMQSYVDVVFKDQICQTEAKVLQIGQFDHSYMSNIWISETVPNCMLDSAYKAKYLKYVLNRNNYPKFGKFLATNCSFFEICIGKFIPELRSNYSGHHIQLDFYSASAPSMNFSAITGANIQSKVFVDWQIQPESEKETVNETLARLEMDLFAEIKPAIYKRRLIGKVLTMEFKLTQIYSKIGQFSDFLLKNLGTVLTPVIQTHIETILKTGIPIPLIKRVELSDMSILSVEDGAVRCNANFEYLN